MPNEIDYLEHFGVKGMKWGKTSASSKGSSSKTGSNQSEGKTRTPMSKEKKVAIAVGVGAVAAIGIAVAMKSMNKNMDLPVVNLPSSPSVSAGRNLLDLGKPKPPSNYPMTPKRPTPVLDATLKKYDSNGNIRQTSPIGSTGAPSLSSLNDIINGGPRIEFDSKTGQYVTR